MKAVKSTDPRKQRIVSKLKQESRGSKVTTVTEVVMHSNSGLARFEGNCFKPELIHDRGFVIRTGKYELIGRFWVNFELNYDGTLGAHINGGKLG